MIAVKQPTIAVHVEGDLPILAKSFERHLRAENKSPKTLETYLESVRMLGRFLAERGMPTDVNHIAREHVEEFLVDLHSRNKPATVSVRFRSLQQFFRWLHEEGEIERDPMERMKQPIVPETPVPVLADAEIVKLLKACEGKEFESVRDMAILRIMLDTGMRRGELANLRVDDVDWEMSVVSVLGKGRRPRAVPLAPKAMRSLDRYMRARARHRFADAPMLWLGRAGPLTSNGVFQIVKDRGRIAGVSVHPHQFRHTYAHMFRLAGGEETDLMVLGGWRSRSMMSRYGQSAAAERAKEAHRKFSPGEKF